MTLTFFLQFMQIKYFKTVFHLIWNVLIMKHFASFTCGMCLKHLYELTVNMLISHKESGRKKEPCNNIYDQHLVNNISMIELNGKH